MKRSDVQLHSDGYGYQRGNPAINVKIHKGLDDGIMAFKKANPEIPARYTEAWIRENLDDESINFWWQQACEHCFEQAEEDAKSIFGQSIHCYSEGRSGGWFVVHGLKDFDSWDAVDLAKWGKCERWTKQTAADVPYQCADLIYYNVFEAMAEKQDAEIQDAQVV